MKIHDKLPLENYLISPQSSPDKQSERYIGKAEGIPTPSESKKKIQMEDNQSPTNYQSNISTTVGTE